MKYFSPKFTSFLQQLSDNNHKNWFDEHRQDYEKFVKEPFERFVSDLIIAIQGFDDDIQIPPKKAIFRINRDIRFSKDKTPYKVHRSAVLSRNNRKEEFPAYYLRIDKDNIHIGGGLFNLSKENLYKVREEIMYNEQEFKKLVEARDFVKIFGSLKGEKNKLLKPPFKEIADQSPILFNKQYYYMTSFSNKIIFQEDIIDQISTKYKEAYPLNQFLKVALEEG